MHDRFTRRSRIGRGHIAKDLRAEILRRDEYSCQYCRRTLDASELTLDHLIPLALGGIDEPTNYVTACMPCNQRKAAMPLPDFALTVGLDVGALPIHGDPIVDNERLPPQIRLIRRQVIERARAGEIRIAGRGAQKRIEKAYRSAFWSSEPGRALAKEFPGLPGHVRVMVPEIQTLATDEREFRLLVELAKSANTRGLIGSVFRTGGRIEEQVRRHAATTRDEALVRRLNWALMRFERAARATRSASRE